MVAAYKKILAFRASHEAVKVGVITPYADTNISAFEKKSGTDDVLILVNTRGTSQTFTIPSTLSGTTWTDGIAGGTVSLSGTITLSAYQYLALSK